MVTCNSSAEKCVFSYRTFANRIVGHQVAAMQAKFPDERYPMRPQYRRAMYERLRAIVDELHWQMEELLTDAPDGQDAKLKDRILALQEDYEQDFIRQVRKTGPRFAAGL